MTNDGTDASAERPQAQPGWGERLALWGFAFVLGLVVSIVLGLSLPALMGDDPARTVGKGIGLGVFFFIIYGPHTLRSFCGYAAVCIAARGIADWLVK